MGVQVPPRPQPPKREGSEMGVIQRLRWLVPVTRTGAAVWAWRNRRELARWAAFARGAVGRYAAGEKADVVAEARLRAGLTRDIRTRGASGLTVGVRHGEAVLSGQVLPQVRAAAVGIAERTKGVDRVRDDMRERGRRYRSRQGRAV